MFKKIAFFVGSGISYCSKAPSVEQLTKEILESAWFLHTDECFYPAPEKIAPNDELMQQAHEDALEIQKFIRLVYEHISNHIANKECRLPNYEDIYGCLSQIFQDETLGIVNPLIVSDMDALKDKSLDLWMPIKLRRGDTRFASLARQAADLIECAICCLLGNKKPKGLDLFIKTKGIVDEMDVFTLNHDTLIEQQFEDAAIPYTDGFGIEDRDVRWFDSKCFSSVRSQDPSAVRLFKLHGSINWLRSSENKYAKALKIPYDLLKDARGKKIDFVGNERNVLTGTITKGQYYGHDPFIELFSQFHCRLKEHNVIIFRAL